VKSNLEHKGFMTYMSPSFDAQCFSAGECHSTALKLKISLIRWVHVHLHHLHTLPYTPYAHRGETYEHPESSSLFGCPQTAAACLLQKQETWFGVLHLFFSMLQETRGWC